MIPMYYCEPEEFLAWAIAFYKHGKEHKAIVLSEGGASNKDTAFAEFRVEFPIDVKFARVAILDYYNKLKEGVRPEELIKN